MHWLTHRRRRPDPGKGLMAGMAGGLAGTVVMTGLELAWSRFQHEVEAERQLQAHARRGTPAPARRGGDGRERAGTPATQVAVLAVSRRITGREPGPWTRRFAAPAVHYAFGTIMGGLYGALAEAYPAVTAGHGTAFGAAVFLVGDEAAMSALRLVRPPHKLPWRRHLMSLVSHLAYGATCEAVRRHARSAMT